MSISITNYTAIVLARKGSKRLPNKNLLPINNTPLYLHAVKQGIRTCGKVILNTDIPSDQLVLPENTSLYERSLLLSGDTVSSSSVILDMIKTLNLSDHILVLLQPTSPLRLDSDIFAAIDLYQNSFYELVMSTSNVDNSCLKYGMLDKGLFNPLSLPEYCFSNKQDLPKVYAPNGAVYVFEASSFLKHKGFPASNIGSINMPSSRSIDIDCYDDFVLASQAFSPLND